MNFYLKQELKNSEDAMKYFTKTLGDIFSNVTNNRQLVTITTNNIKEITANKSGDLIKLICVVAVCHYICIPWNGQGRRLWVGCEIVTEKQHNNARKEDFLKIAFTEMRIHKKKDCKEEEKKAINRENTEKNIKK